MKIFISWRSIFWLGVGKRDGIHPDTERDCHFYYQCVAQNKMREAKCPGDQKFSSYSARCGPSAHAPMPCGSYVPGNTAISTSRFSLFSYIHDDDFSLAHWSVAILFLCTIGIFNVIFSKHQWCEQSLLFFCSFIRSSSFSIQKRSFSMRRSMCLCCCS